MAVENLATNQTSQQKDSRPTTSQVSSLQTMEYAKRVSDYSKLTTSASLFAGGHFENLAAYLNQPFIPRAPNLMQSRVHDTEGRNFQFVSLYDLDPQKSRKPKHLSSISEFEQEVGVILDDSRFGHILFMRGHPSPEWLLAIGSIYQVDPEYFQRYLDFFLGQPQYFPLPSLPSTSLPMIRLRITTIGGSQTPPISFNRQEELEALQIENAALTKAYREDIRIHRNSNLGDSVVRDCSIHDLCHFSIEQDIFINVSKTKKSWVCLVWLDLGKPLDKGPANVLASPLREKHDAWQIRYLPVLQHKVGVALRTRSKLLAPVNTAQRGQSSLLQSAALLHLDYGRSLDRNTLSFDPFYALHELFVFAAFSEAQFLNMLESKLEQELEHSALVWQKNATLSNLVYHQKILDRHIVSLRENLASIGEAIAAYNSDHASEENKLRGAMAAAKSLQKDYQHLLERAIALFERTSRGVQVVMNNAMIKESREAMVQAEGVVKLTRLAFVFIPLSFTTAFFGMNFEEFGTGKLPLWIWAVVSFPIVIATFLLLRSSHDVSFWSRLFGGRIK